MAVLEVRDLDVTIGTARILRGISLDLEAGKALGIVGESGCGKSMTGFAIMGMLPSGGKVSRGSIKLEGQDLVQASDKEYRQVRGRRIALVMQDPFTSLNPMMRVGHQIAEAMLLHQEITKDQAWKKSVELLDRVGVPAPDHSARKYPHQMSGGQRQRVVIAMAFACKPEVLIADEPTTALDVTLQAQILRLIRELMESEGTAVMIISHDIGVIGSIADRVAVFYAGRVVESGPVTGVLTHPIHPYTRAMLAALPMRGASRLESIGGQPPDLTKPIEGCPFAPRCGFKVSACSEMPETKDFELAHSAACWRGGELLMAGPAGSTGPKPVVH